MPAYLIANIDVTNPSIYEEYRKGVLATIQQHGGRFVARGGTTVALEGTFTPKRVVIIEFPSLDAARAWHASPEYAPLLALRQRASTGDVFAVEGA